MSDASDDDRLRREKEERDSNRRQVEKRARQWAVASDEENDAKRRRSSRSNSEEKHHRRSSKHRRKNDYESSESSNDDRRQSRKHKQHKHEKKSKKHKRKKKHHKKKRHRRDYSSDDYSSSDDSSRDSYREKKRKKKRKKEKSSKSTTSSVPSGAGTFGKYGIIKPSDFYQHQRTFEIWMAEVKGIPSFTGPKWELQKYFAEFCEDYNTATMPHAKYYNYNEWEIQQHKLKQQQTETKGGALADEAQHRAMLDQKRKEKEQQELELVKARMNKDKVEEMKRQTFLKSTMAHAFKTGDQETFQRLQKKLEPEDDRNKKAASHPWSR